MVSAHFFGYVFMRLRQPRLIGEIFAGILLGPFVLGRFAPLIFTNLFFVVFVLGLVSTLFIPVYFALVGYRLVFGRDFSFGLLLFFLAGSSLLAFVSKGLAAKLAGFRKMDVINIAITIARNDGT